MSWLRPWVRGAARGRAPLVLYTRAACPLCDEMKADLARAGTIRESGWSEVDVDSDPVLAERFGECVPVLEVGGRLAFRARIRPGTLRRRLAQLERAWRQRGPGPGAAREVTEGTEDVRA